jgi:octopine/nopaline transport system substrate-binding protein
MKRRALAFGLTLFALSAVGGPLHAKEWTTVRIATEGAYAPWNFKTSSGDLDGFDVELAKDLCARMKVECEIIEQDWDGIIPALNAGKYDAIVASLTITEKRREAIAFSSVYADTPRTFLVKKNGSLASLAADEKVYSFVKDPQGTQAQIDALKPVLSGKTVGVQVNTTGESFLQKYFEGVVQVRSYKTAEQYLLDLEADRIDAALDNIAYLGGVLNSPTGGGLQMAGPRFNDGVFGGGKAVGLRKGDSDLKAMFDAALASAIEEGTVKALSLKWFKVDVTPQ